jgi:hypothetical protein
MFKAVGRYFLSGRKVCLVGVFALGMSATALPLKVQSYFAEWVQALATALERGGRDHTALALAEDVVGGSRRAGAGACIDEPALFMRALERMGNAWIELLGAGASN